MNRQDMKVGQDYLYSTRSEWAGASGNPKRVRLLDKGKWRSQSFLGKAGQVSRRVKTESGELDLPERIQPGGKYSLDLLVEDLQPDGQQTGRYRTVRSVEIKAEWDYGMEIVEQNAKIRAEKNAKAKAEREAGQAVIDAFHEKFGTTQQNQWGASHEQVRLSLEDAQMVMEQGRD